MMICIPSLRTPVPIPNHVLNSHYYYPSSALYQLDREYDIPYQ